MRPAPLLLWVCIAWAVLGLAVSVGIAPAFAWWAAGGFIAVLAAVDAWRLQRQASPDATRIRISGVMA